MAQSTNNWGRDDLDGARRLNRDLTKAIMKHLVAELCREYWGLMFQDIFWGASVRLGFRRQLLAFDTELTTRCEHFR
jgi:hypothetical protein